VPRELYLRRPGILELLPVLCAALLGGFWMVFASQSLPVELYAKQDTLYAILLWALFLLCLLPALRRRGKGLLPALALGAGGLTLPKFGTLMVYIVNNGVYADAFRVASRAYQNQAFRRPDLFVLHTAGDSSTLLAAAVIAAACLALAFVGLRKKQAPADPAPESHT